MNIPRRAHEEVLDGLRLMPGVVLLGPRQVGKTTLAQSIVDAQADAAYFDLRDTQQREAARDPRQWLDLQPGLVVLDEVQEVPELFAPLRGVIDDRRRAGRRTGQFLLLGSASDRLLHQTTESLAGRVRYIELTPILGTELDAGRIGTDQLWLRGGFPDSLLAPSDRDSFALRRDFIRSYLERDIPHLAPRIPARTLERFWTMLAHRQGQPFNASDLARSIEASPPTATRYLDVLEDLMLVRRLQPWFENVGKRLLKSPRVYVRDTGILHALLGIGDLSQLMLHPIVGASWEGFVIEQLIAAVGPHHAPWYYRTRSGAELDLFFDLQGGGRWAIEIKRSRTPRPARGFHVAADDVGATHRIVVHAGELTIPLRGGVTAMPLHAAVESLREASQT